MKRHLQLIVLSVLSVLALSTASPACAQRSPFLSFQESEVSFKISEESEPLADLYLQLMTRPGVTAGADMHALRFAAHEAAKAFRQTLFRSSGGRVKSASFKKDVGILVHAYLREYSLASEGVAGAEGKGAALDRLIDGVLHASNRSGFSHEELNLALLRGAATVEACISERPLSRVLSLTDREMALLLMRTSVNQVRHRTFLDSTRLALQHLPAPEKITNLYESRFYAVRRSSLKAELVRLEKYLADMLFGSDLQQIIVAQFNNEAVSDLYAGLYSVEQYILSSSLQESLISSLAAVIPAMTPELLQEQLSIASGSSPIPFTTLAVYGVVTPSLHLSYFPVRGLIDRLTLLGVTPPEPPNSFLFTDSYRALNLMNYDILLCDLITAREWSEARNAFQDQSRPLSLEKQLMLKKAALKRFSQVRAHLRGVPEESARELQILMQSNLNMRI